MTKNGVQSNKFTWCIYIYIHIIDSTLKTTAIFTALARHQSNSMHVNNRTAAAICLNYFHVNKDVPDIPTHHTSPDYFSLPCSTTLNAGLPVSGVTRFFWGRQSLADSSFKGTRDF